VLDAKEWRKLIDSIPTETVRDLRDRALIATLSYSFARITAALRMKVEDLRPQGAGWRVRLAEKGGKLHEMPYHHALAEALHSYIAAAGIAEDRKGWLFRTSPRHNATVFDRAADEPGRRLAHDPPGGLWPPASRRRSVTTLFARRGSPPISAMAAHESPRTTKLYDRTQDRLTQDEVERIRL
jgi:integrase